MELRMYRNYEQNWIASRNRDAESKKNGVRTSSFSNLVSFDIVRQHAVDPMHNLFLGTASYLYNFWDSKGYFNDKYKRTLHQFLKYSGSQFNYFPVGFVEYWSQATADQWRHWVLHISTTFLSLVLPKNDLFCWRYFVKACWLLSCPILDKDSLTLAQESFQQFAKLMFSITKKVTTNAHMHVHLIQIIKDFGPVSSFWCFPLERLHQQLMRAAKSPDKEAAIINNQLRNMKINFTLNNSMLKNNLTPEQSNILTKTSNSKNKNAITKNITTKEDYDLIYNDFLSASRIQKEIEITPQSRIKRCSYTDSYQLNMVNAALMSLKRKNAIPQDTNAADAFLEEFDSVIIGGESLRIGDNIVTTFSYSLSESIDNHSAYLSIIQKFLKLNLSRLNLSPTYSCVCNFYKIYKVGNAVQPTIYNLKPLNDLERTFYLEDTEINTIIPLNLIAYKCFVIPTKMDDKILFQARPLMKMSVYN
jgi:hypothetical protein